MSDISLNRCYVSPRVVSVLESQLSVPSSVVFYLFGLVLFICHVYFFTGA